MQLLREGRSFSGHERNCAFLNMMGGRFANASSITGLDFADDGRAVAVTDWDQDGDLDLWLANRTGPRLRLMRNQRIVDHIPNNARFIRFRLQGTASNRDAIGARVLLRSRNTGSGLSTGQVSGAVSDRDDRHVTMNMPETVAMQTLYAGDAYLSQSSKWLHFGLGADSEITEVNVQWPNGQREKFSASELAVGKRYRLVEGTGAVSEVPYTDRSLVLKPAKQELLEPSLIGQALFSNRLPMPILRYESFDGSGTSVVQTQQRPLLVTLWASWCPTCVGELTTLQEHVGDLDKAGLGILALSLDGLDRSRETGITQARALLDKLKVTFPTGMATRELLDKFEFTEGIVLNRQSSLAVPTSFLLDADGSLAAIYRGPVEPSELREYLTKLDLPLEQRRNLAVPLAGRWGRAPREMLLRAVARLFDERGYAEDNARYLALDTDIIKQRRSLARSPEQRSKWDAEYAKANFELGLAFESAGDVPAAIAHFQCTVEVQPNHTQASVNLGALLARSGQPVAAIKSLRKAVRLEPNSIKARMNLAMALGSQGEFGESIAHYKHVLTVESDTPKVHARLARALLEMGELQEAAKHLERAVADDSNDFPATLSLAWLRATSPDPALRDGPQAMQLVQRLNMVGKGNEPLVLDVLAASFAEQGNFEQAQTEVSKAVRLVGRNQTLKSLLLARLKSYESGKPHRDDDGRYP